MSITWQDISSRPSSKMANRPQGPAPTITTSVVTVSPLMDHSSESSWGSRQRSELLLGDLHRQPVKSVGDLDLAGQAAVVANVEGEVQHVLFHLVAGADPFPPFGLDIDMTGGAGAGAAAVGIDARHHVLDRRFHHGHAVLAFDLLLCPVLLDESQPCHSSCSKIVEIDRFRRN